MSAVVRSLQAWWTSTRRMKPTPAKERRATRCLEAVEEGTRFLRPGRSYVVVKPVVDNPDAWFGSADVGRREARNDKGGWLQNDKRLLVKICAIKGVGVFIFVVLVLHLKTDLSINGQYLLHFGKRRCCR